ncbi:hypothetical protein DL765_009792 [Monosporascus sp. GIB2]|nr:hypothetical protein DL765_009792 [Monosporascus sp. GIB2]
MSVIWTHGSNAEWFGQPVCFIAQECPVPSHDDPKADGLSLVKRWPEKDRGRWLMVIDNVDNLQVSSASRNRTIVLGYADKLEAK